MITLSTALACKAAIQNTLILISWGKYGHNTGYYHVGDRKSQKQIQFQSDHSISVVVNLKNLQISGDLSKGPRYLSGCLHAHHDHTDALVESFSLHPLFYSNTSAFLLPCTLKAERNIWSFITNEPNPAVFTQSKLSLKPM